MTPKMQGYLYLALAMALVGSTVVASKVIAAGLPPFTATALRLALALPCFVLLMRRAGVSLPRPDRRDGLLLLVQATAGSVGYTTLLIAGLTLTSATDGGVIVGTLPVVSAAVAILVLGERPRPSVLAAIALAAGGVLAITLQPGGDGQRSALGNVLIVGAVICEGLFILLNKRLRREIPPLAQSTVMTGLGLLVALVPAVLEQPWTASFDAATAWAIVYYALVPTVGGYLLWYAGAARVSGAEAALFTAVAPVAAVTLAFSVLGEPIGLNQALGVGLVLVAVFSLAARKTG
ncbi:MAG: DMT family transporter [Ferrovibrionaceae bacterium]